VQQDVTRFDIPMNDALLVGVIKGGRQPIEETRNLIRGDALFPLVQIAQICGERGTL